MIFFCQVTHKAGDLFACPAEDSLAHCISEDARMGAGIAVVFKKKYKGVDEILKQSMNGLFEYQYYIFIFIIDLILLLSY